MRLFTGVRPALLALLIGSLFTVSAQNALPDAGYAGPRFPGGPDSLRVYLARHPLRKAGEGPVFVQFDVLPSARRHKPTLILPPGRPPLTPAVAAAALRLVAEMPEWSPGRQDVEVPITTVTLRLATGSVPPAAARAYADEMPVFDGLEPGIVGFYRYMPNVQVVTPEIIDK